MFFAIGLFFGLLAVTCSNVWNSAPQDINALELEGLVILEQIGGDKYKVKLSLKGEMFLEEGGYENVFHKKKKEKKYNLTILICYIITALGGMATALITLFK